MARKTPMHPLKAKEARRNALFTVPMACLAVLLVALPLIYVAGMALTTADGRFTLQNFQGIFRADYLLVFMNSLKLAFYTTVISLLIGYPFGYFMARSGRRWALPSSISPMIRKRPSTCPTASP